MIVGDVGWWGKRENVPPAFSRATKLPPFQIRPPRMKKWCGGFKQMLSLLEQHYTSGTFTCIYIHMQRADVHCTPPKCFCWMRMSWPIAFFFFFKCICNTRVLRKKPLDSTGRPLTRRRSSLDSPHQELINLVMSPSVAHCESTSRWPKRILGLWILGNGAKRTFILGN